jgi:CubicO group peptidase (beta-lactamase class C family)
MPDPDRRRALALAAALPLAACSSWPTTPTLQSRLDAFMQTEMQRARVPGAAVMLLRHGEPLAAGAYGLANLELKVPVALDSVFEIASVTKPFTAAAVLLLAHEGRLSLDDRISSFIDATPPAWAEITLRQLMAHTAGLEHRFEPTVNGVLLLDYSTESLLAHAKTLPTFAAPGVRWRYSDQGYFLLGLAIERASGQSYGTFLAERFFRPLGMQDTRLQDQAQILPRRVAGYTLRDGPEGKAWVNIRRAWQFGLTSHFGILSTVPDLAKWERALLGGPVLPEAVRRLMHEPLRVLRRDAAKASLLAYGHGWWVIHDAGHRMIEHSGFTGTHHFRDLDTGLAAIVLTNRDQPSGPGTVEIARGAARLVDESVPMPSG